MARLSTPRVFGILFIVALLLIGVALVRSCHSTEDPQHFEDDDLTQADSAPLPSHTALR